MNKQVIIGSAFVMSMVLLPVAVQARRGTDDPAGHVRQEDKHANRQEDKISSGTVQGVSTTNARNSTDDSGTDRSQSTPRAIAQISEGQTTQEQAVALAKKQFPDKTYEKTEQESEEGVLVWSVRFTDGSRVDVSVETGDITRIKDKVNDSESDDDNEEDSDDNSGRNHTEDN